MYYNTKDGRAFYISKEEEKDYSLTELIARDVNYNEIGFLNYIVKNRKACLHKIEVTQEQYLNQGVGHYLITEFEDNLKQMGVPEIWGKYYPEGIGGHLTEEFYKRHGYEVIQYDQGDWEVKKTLDLDNKNDTKSDNLSNTKSDNSNSVKNNNPKDTKSDNKKSQELVI